MSLPERLVLFISGLKDLVLFGDVTMSKRTFLRLFFGIEIILFSASYFFGPNGIKTVNELYSDQEELIQEINSLKKEVLAIEHQIAVWLSDDFYKEKIAREQLQMARKDEQIYFVNHKNHRG